MNIIRISLGVRQNVEWKVSNTECFPCIKLKMVGRNTN